MRSLASFGFSLVLLLASIGVGHASEAQLRDAYAAYQVAADAGDLHGALPHAQRAYELGLELYGPESRSTGLLAFNLGYIYNEMLEFNQANDSLRAGLVAFETSIGPDSAELYDTLLELGRAGLGRLDVPTARESLLRALNIANREYGDESFQAGQAHYYLSFIPLFFELDGTRQAFVRSGVDLNTGALMLAQHPWLPYYLRQDIERRYRQGTPEPELELSSEHPVGQDHLDAAISVFGSNSEWAVYLARAMLIQSAYLLDAGGGDDVDRQFREWIDRLIVFQYSDEFLIRLASTWINARHRRGWSLDDMAENITRVGQLAYLRREGELFPLARVPPSYPRNALNVQMEGDVCLTFTVSRDGLSEDIEVSHSNHPRYFDRPSIEALEQFIYAPKMVNGIAVSREDVSNCFAYRMAE